MELIDGKQTAARIREELAAEVRKRVASGKKVPHLAAVIVGHDGASETYVASKVRACHEIGFHSTLLRFEEDVSEQELLRQVDELNRNEQVDGFIVQLPLPPHISESRVIETIHPDKDVDGFHPVSLGRMVQGLPGFVSATPAGILELIRRYKIPTEGKSCVVVGRSNIVGTPLSILLSRKAYPGNATVTLCHSRTADLARYTREADILVLALGKPGFLKGDMVKEGAVVIDVGTTRVPSTETRSGFRLKGDADFEEVAPRCSHITPVPGGVGPMTIVSLLMNTLQAARNRD